MIVITSISVANLLKLFFSPRALNLRARFARRRAVLAIIVGDTATLSLVSFSSQSLFYVHIFYFCHLYIVKGIALVPLQLKLIIIILWRTFF